MWPFKRKAKRNQTVPAEIQEYYQSERRERVGIAWLLALATLVATVVLAIILFYGGRWAYRAIFDRDQASNGTSQEENRGDDASDDATDKPTQLPGGDDRDQDSTNGGSQPEEPGEEPQPTPPRTPATGDGALPQTGPSGQLY